MKNIKTLFCLLLIAHPLAAAGEGGEEGTRVQIPRYTELQRGQTSYVGTVTENGKQFRIKDISFTGETILHGLQSEISDSRIALDLGDVLAIEVIESVYRSEKFDQEFIKTRVIPKKKTAAGEHVPQEILFPRNVQFSATDLQTDLDHAWWLRDVQKIEIDDPQPVIAPNTTPAR